MPLDDVFWDDEREEMYSVVFPHVREAALSGARHATEALVSEVGVGIDWALVNAAAVSWAREYSLALVADITDTSRDFVRQEVAAWIASGEPLDALVQALTPMFGEVRAEMIAVTETTRAYAEGNIASWTASGVVEGMQWMTAQDELVCPICEPLAGRVAALNGDGFSLDDDMGIGAPPAHVRCRCWLQPVVKVN